MERPVATPAKKLTHTDFLLFPDDGKRHELIDGEHYVGPSPVRRHQAILRNLFLELGPFVRDCGLGEIYFAPLDVILSDIDVVAPDLLFVSNERREILQDWVRGAPDLVVEILSPSTRSRDERLKRDLYERKGVEEYWVVDPEAETIKLYRADGGGYGRPDLLARDRGDSVSSPLLSDLRLSLDAVFR